MRESRFELLRLVAIIFVLVVHAIPSIRSGRCGFECWGVEGLESVAIIGVNLFILISGWFTIRLKLKSVLNFAFLVGFWLVAMLFLRRFGFGESLTASSIINGLNPFRNWFIAAYVLLMLLSPLLNAFIEKSTRRELAGYTALFFGVEFMVDHVMPLKMWGVFQGGYSFLGFIGVYLLGALLRRFEDVFIGRVRLLAFAYGGLIVATTLIVCCVSILPGSGATGVLREHTLWSFRAYSFPLAILGAALLFAMFTQIRLKSRIVNHLAQSTFAIFLAHCHGYYGAAISKLHETNGGGADSCVYRLGFRRGDSCRSTAAYLLEGTGEDL